MWGYLNQPYHVVLSALAAYNLNKYVTASTSPVIDQLHFSAMVMKEYILQQLSITRGMMKRQKDLVALGKF